MIRLKHLNKNKIGEFGHVIIRYASSQLLSKSMNMLSGFLVIRLLSPGDVGIYNGVGIYLGYLLLGHGGILNGLGREFPFQRGKGNDFLAFRMASSAWVLSITLSAISSIIFLGISIYFFINHNNLVGLVYLSYVITGFFSLLNGQYLPLLYRNNEDFISLSKQNSMFGIANIVSVLFVVFFGFYGLIIRGISLAAYQFYLLFRNKPVKLRWDYYFDDYKKLFKTGFPIYLIGYINSLWATILYNIIFKTGGAIAFGLYSISSIIQGAIGVIPTAFGVITYPRMTTMFAQGSSVEKIIKGNLKVLLFQFGFLLVIAITTVLLLPILIPLILPKYMGGILAAQWMCFVPVAQTFDTLNNIYNVINRQKMLFVSLILGALFGIIYTIIRIRYNGFRLEFFPQGLLIGIIIQQILSLFFILKMVKRENSFT